MTTTAEMKEKQEKMEVASPTWQVAIITYNRIGEGEYENGVTDGPGIRLFIAQNGHKSKWAADPDYGSRASRKETRVRMARHVTNMVNLEDMDHVFIYVGGSGGEETIRQSRDLPANKVTYVMCDCNWDNKNEMIKSIGNAGAKVIECSCGGQIVLAGIVKRLLAGTKPEKIS